MATIKDDLLNDFADSQALTVVAPTPLPTIQAMRENMAMARARRDLLAEYVRTYMDPARHAYDPAALHMGGDHKLRLNQDGARNLCGLYEVMPGEPLIEETMQDRHLDVRVKVPLRNHADKVLYWGIGFCSTREGKYAYRWVSEADIPAGLNKRELRSRRSAYGTRYRIPNDDIADQYHTVRMMALKRAEVAATMKLPGVTEVFAAEGEAEEESAETRAALLKTLKGQLGTIPAKDRPPVLQKLFGITYADLDKTPVPTLERYAQTLEEFTAAGIQWRSPTLLDDLSTLIGTQGAKAAGELFGDEPRERET